MLFLQILKESWIECLVWLAVLLPAVILIIGGDFSNVDLSWPVVATVILAFMAVIIGKHRHTEHHQ
ncbi:MAG: hypothetical protein D6737_06140 [Chloroflexi bacterium]|nr:MAG: hypothetical protein D6737_06140 [Chloroflexota bacterium]